MLVEYLELIYILLSFELLGPKIMQTQKDTFVVISSNIRPCMEFHFQNDTEYNLHMWNTIYIIMRILYSDNIRVKWSFLSLSFPVFKETTQGFPNKGGQYFTIW